MYGVDKSITHNELPPNLDADEPSQSFLMKGADISIAALQAELVFLASPVANHVQTVEMGNQTPNSLALLSARYTQTALDKLTQLTVAYLCVKFQLKRRESSLVATKLSKVLNPPEHRRHVKVKQTAKSVEKR